MGEVLNTARIEEVLDRLGFELVVLEKGRGKSPRLKLRIDRPGDDPGHSSVSVEDCTSVARALREAFEADESLGDLAIEVSSPGVERPLVRERDYVRFAGQRARLRGYGPLAGKSRVLEGRLQGVEEGRVGIEVDGELHHVPLEAIAGARLAYEW